MDSNYHFTTPSSLFLHFIFFLIFISSSMATLVKQKPLVLNYHKGALLKGAVNINLIWYGNFSSTQRSVIFDFIQSLSFRNPQAMPSVSSWWNTTNKYNFTGGARASTILVGKQIFDDNYSVGKILSNSQILSLAHMNGNPGIQTINVVLTGKNVSVEGFCMNRCGSHSSVSARGELPFVYAWVGNPETQCPGYCAWPFHQPVSGPQGKPLVSPNGDVGVDGMVINLATVLAGTVTNPFNSGYFQGPSSAPLEAVSACTGVFGSGAYPGFAGKVLKDKSTGSSYNAQGVNGRRYLLPAMWDPKTSNCSTLV